MFSRVEVTSAETIIMPSINKSPAQIHNIMHKEALINEFFSFGDIGGVSTEIHL